MTSATLCPPRTEVKMGMLAQLAPLARVTLDAIVVNPSQGECRNDAYMQKAFSL